MKEFELKKLRKRREKHFLQENGNIVVNVYDEDIHFKNEYEYEEIDNTLILENNYYTNKKNEYHTYFYNNYNDYLMIIKKEDYYIKFKLENCNKILLKKEEETIYYRELLKDIDFKYKLIGNKVKEEIILNKKQNEINKISFMIETNLNLEIRNKVVNASKDNKIIFQIDAPYMYDSNNNINQNIYYKISKKDNNYILDLILDDEWLNNDNTKYPVTVDPTITNRGNDTSCYDTYIYPGDANVDRNAKDILKVGIERNNETDIINRALIKFDLPTIGTGSQIVGASLNLIGYPILGGSYESEIIAVHQITSSWTEETATWDTMNDNYNERMEGAFDSARSGMDVSGNIEPYSCTVDITNLVKKWYSHLPNYGIMLKANKEEYQSNVVPAFFSKNNAVSGNNPKPILSIIYRNQNGLENYIDYKTQSYSNGNTYINSYNGNLTGIFNLGSTLHGKLPISLNLIYNTNDVVLNNNIGYGLGYRLSLNQTIQNVVIDSINYLEYIDEDGTIHYFKEDNGIFYDEDGLNFTIIENDNDYVLKDKNNNQMKFIKNNEIGYLSEIKDVSNNIITINYNTKNLIYKIIDANNNEINITYNTNKILFNSAAGEVSLNYSNNQLTSIETITGITTIVYNENNIINSITDENGLKNVYEYYNQIPYRMKKVIQYGIENNEGNSFDISYGFDCTTIVDNNDKATTMTFNSYGNVSSVSNLKSKEDVKNAYGQGKTYGEEDYYITIYKNKLLETEQPLKYVKNYLTNTSFESDYIGFITTEDVNLELSTEYSETGFSSLKVVNNSINKVLEQVIDVPKGNYYNFSAYLKNTNNIRLSLSYINSENEVIESFSEQIMQNNKFERYDVTINYPIDAVSNLYIKIYLDEIGTTYIDDIQLEEGQVSNNYNMLENSDFSSDIIDWQLSAYDIKTTEDVSTEDKFQIVTLENGIKALNVKMNPAYSTSFFKTFDIRGKLGDTYCISFWYKNEGFVGIDDVGQGPFNNVIINFNYTDQSGGHGISPSKAFNPNDTEWQYFSTSFTAEKDFESLKLNFFQSYNANNFYITNISLFKDVRTINYNYDESGNVINFSNLDNQSSEFNYDKNNQLIKMINPKGKHFSFEYDNTVTDRVINGISDIGISNEIKYDSYGNPISTKIINHNLNSQINNGLYKIRLKGTSKYIRYINDSINVNEDNCNHDLWNIEMSGEYYKIYHSIILNKYLTIKNNSLILSEFNNDSSLFTLIKNNNGSYLIKLKDSDNYLNFNENTIEVAPLIEDDYHYQFYLESIDNPLFIENNAEYTEDGRFIKSTTDTLFNKTLYDIDSITGLTKAVTNAKGETTYYNYNDKRQLTSVTTGNKNVTYTYNNQNLLSSIIQDNKQYKIIYDEFLNPKTIKIGDNITLVTNNYESNNGKLLSTTYGNDHNINFDYDDFNRIKTLTKMNDIYNYKYGNNGDLIKIISNNDTIKYTYDLAKRLSQYRFNDFKIKYTYDSNENIINTIYNLNNINNNVENIFNDDDSIIKTVIENNEINYNYDNLGRIINSNINNQFNTNYTYLTNGKRTSLIVKSIENNNDLYSYKYDKLNNITHIYHNNILENKYYYDSYNQLIKENNYITNETIKYNYDNSGNIIYKKVYNLKTYNFLYENKYEYNNTNWVDQLTKYNDDIITYDEIGNPLTIGNNIILNWINGRQLNSYVDTNNTITYKYNKDSIRTSKIVNNIETKYYLEGKDIIFEKTNGNVLYFIRNEIDGLIGFKYNNNTYYYIKNNQDDIIGILDDNYNVLVKYTYDSWGNIISILDNNNNDISSDTNHIANINPYRYRSYYYDRETNLYYLNSRYYNPIWGRFINADSMIIQNTSLLGCNLYIYSFNNPINLVDLSGKGPITNWLKKTAKKVKKATKHVFNTAARIVINGCSELSSLFGLKTAASLLTQSIQDTPKNITYTKNSSVAQQIKNNKEFQKAINAFAEANPNGDYYQQAVNVRFNFSDMDLGLAFHNATFYVSGTLKNGSGNLNIYLKDTYDFKNEKYPTSSLSTNAINSINNIANFLEGTGAINKYDIIVTFDYCVNCN